MQDEPDLIFAVEIACLGKDRNHLHMTRGACTVETKAERFPAFRASGSAQLPEAEPQPPHDLRDKHSEGQRNHSMLREEIRRL
jgi:hypothetical protein